MKQAEWIYETMMGEVEIGHPGVSNAFEEGERCTKLYEEIYLANRALCDRLGVEEDEFVETIINNFFAMNRELCLIRYEIGVRHGMRIR